MTPDGLSCGVAKINNMSLPGGIITLISLAANMINIWKTKLRIPVDASLRWVYTERDRDRERDFSSVQSFK